MESELIRRQTAKTSFLDFCVEALKPLGHKPAKHHRLLISELEKVERGETRNLMVFMPPGSAKSTYGSVLFPAWYMSRRRRRHVVAASNIQDLAETFSRKVQSTVAENALLLDNNVARENAKAWYTTNGSHYYAIGVGGSIRGVRSELTVIDDPVRTAADVASDTNRNSVWDWFNADIVSRGIPGARIVLIMTRYHEDDLAGRLLAVQPKAWKVVNLPFTALEDDALGRKPGELLWADDDYNYAQDILARRAAAEERGAMRDWNAQYEQDPRPGDGGIFTPGNLQNLDCPLPYADYKKLIRAWDLAATEQTGSNDPDWTVGALLGETQDGRYHIVDVVRMRGGPEAVVETIKATAKADGPRVRISLPLDPGQASKHQVRYITSELRGYSVSSSPESGNKQQRAMPFAAQVNVGNVSLVRGQWNLAYTTELEWFPAGKKDDQVDASSRAFMELVAAPAPAKWRRINVMGR